MCDAITLSIMLSVKLLMYILSYIEFNSCVYVVFWAEFTLIRNVWCDNFISDIKCEVIDVYFIVYSAKNIIKLRTLLNGNRHGI